VRACIWQQSKKLGLGAKRWFVSRFDTSLMREAAGVHSKMPAAGRDGGQPSSTGSADRQCPPQSASERLVPFHALRTNCASHALAVTSMHSLRDVLLLRAGSTSSTAGDVLPDPRSQAVGWHSRQRPQSLASVRFPKTEAKSPPSTLSTAVRANEPGSRQSLTSPRCIGPWCRMVTI
jgi:hypothetical protein